MSIKTARVPEQVVSAGNIISGHMDKILRLFKPGAKITVVVRFPGLPDRDLIMSDDELEDVIEACRRRNGEPEPSGDPSALPGSCDQPDDGNLIR